MARNLGVVEWVVFVIIAAVAGGLVASWGGWTVATSAKNWWDVATAIGTVGAAFGAPFLYYKQKRHEERLGKLADLGATRDAKNALVMASAVIKNRFQNSSAFSLVLLERAIQTMMSSRKNVRDQHIADELRFAYGRMCDLKWFISQIHDAPEHNRYQVYTEHAVSIMLAQKAILQAKRKLCLRDRYLTGDLGLEDHSLAVRFPDETVHKTRRRPDPDPFTSKRYAWPSKTPERTAFIERHSLKPST